MTPSRRHRYRRPYSLAKRFRPGSLKSSKLPAKWLCLNGLIWAAVGAILATFSVPLWVWGLVLGGTVAQTSVLAGPRSLARFRWWSANFLVLLAILGAGAIVSGLSIALSYAGTENLDQVVPMEFGLDVLKMSTVALLIGGLGAVVNAAVGDRLLISFNHLQTVVILAASSFSGLGIGSLIGWLIVVA